MKLVRTESFKKDWKKLSRGVRPRAIKALRLLVIDIKHPSLRVKKVQGTKRIWQASVILRYRFTFEMRRGAFVLRRIGSHKTVETP